ncbi:unnamed protein product [Sympodiomycopsis kandeliae]
MSSFSAGAIPEEPSPWTEEQTLEPSERGSSLRPPQPSRDPVARALSYAGYASPHHDPAKDGQQETASLENGTHTNGPRPKSMFLTPSFRSFRSEFAGPNASRPHHPPRIPSSAAPPQLSDSMENETTTWRARAQGETPLERTIDAIGMGRYQWALLILTGCGWAADNMWLQGVAIILPRVQEDFQISDTYIGLLSSSTFAGMMVGALGWGSYSDTYGRRDAFNGTLTIVAIFGTLTAFANNFLILCICLFLLGLGLGGSMPTDGTLFMENLPKRKQYLLTALSVFFSAGSVASSILGLIIIPGSVSRWRWFLGSLGMVTILFLALRLVFFRLLESPRYLVSSGRPEEARVALQRIAAFNGAPLPVSLSDVSNDRPYSSSRRGSEIQEGQEDEAEEQQGVGRQRNSRGYTALAQDDDVSNTQSQEQRGPTSSGPGLLSTLFERLPPHWQDGLQSLKSKYDILLNDQWRATSLLIWGIWSSVTLAYTMFNVFLPKLLESRLGNQQPTSSTSVMEDYLLYSLASLPGSILGAYLIETRIGRKGTMAASLATTGLAVVSFILATGRLSIVISSMFISLAAGTAYAAIYGYTPEVFETDVRGTASGTASALSRFAGMIAPLLAGVLFSISLSAPLIVSVLLFSSSVLMAVSLPIETRGRISTEEDEGATFAH